MIALLSVLVASVVQGQTVMGADALLRATQPKATVSRARVLEGLADSYVRRSDRMALDGAAKAYVELVSECMVADPTESNEMNWTPRLLVEALPRPEVWPRIRDLLGHLPNGDRMKKVRLLFDTLLSADADALRETDSARPAGTDEKVTRYEDSQIEDDLRHGKLDAAAEDPGEVFDPVLFEPLGRMLSSHPDSRRWDEYEVLGRRLGKLDRVEGRLNAAIEQAGPAYERVLIARRAELEARSGDGAAAIADLTAACRMQMPRDGDDKTLGDLERIAVATGDRQALDTAAKNGYRGSNFAGAFVSQGRLVDAQRQLIQCAGDPMYIGRERPVDLPVSFAELYYRIGRPDQVVQLLDSYPDWASDDLVDLLTARGISNPQEDTVNNCLGFFAAWGLAGTGRKALAIKILHAFLPYTHYQDDGFDLLNRLEGQSALSFYEDLIRLDPYSAARPMAWKADLLLRLGRLKEAEVLARSAVAKDPTDGSAPRGHRLMSYTILARVLRASGKIAEAAKYERVVKAVRIGEDGDVYREAKLIPQALAKYREADKVFDGAYCIHLRMAICLFSLGNYSEGTREYRKACELLPSSFGEVSYRCLGCNGLPDDPGLKSIQVEVLSGVVKKDPTKSVGWFLLGQAYQDSGNAVRAAETYQSAVRLDPSYLEAWTEMLTLNRSEVGGEILKTAAKRVLQLNPRFPNGQALKYYRGYAEIWKAYHDGWRGLEQWPVGPLYPLHTSGKAGRYREFERTGVVGPGTARLFRSPGSILYNMREFDAL